MSNLALKRELNTNSAPVCIILFRAALIQTEQTGVDIPAGVSNRACWKWSAVTVRIECIRVWGVSELTECRTPAKAAATAE